MAKCRICGYQWEPRGKEPKACPRCKRYDWKEPVKILSVALAFILILSTVQTVQINQTNYELTNYTILNSISVIGNRNIYMTKVYHFVK
jgi:hypothetical protein